MFTGIVTNQGRLASKQETADQNIQIAVELMNPFQDEALKLGESIAVNGVCLTLVQVKDQKIFFDVGPETIRVSTLSHLKIGTELNLERALRVGDRLGGHWVQGHVDTKGIVSAIQPEGNSHWVSIQLSDQFSKYCVSKGSITLDGISLTIARIVSQSQKLQLDFQIIPHTWQFTNLKSLKIGDAVNIEMDVMAKWALQGRSNENH